MQNWQSKLAKKIKKYLHGYTACHDFYHLERVHNYAMDIAKNICNDADCDLDSLWAASFMHDIGYKNNEKDDKNHNIHGMKLAEKWLTEVGFPKEKIPTVLEIIRLHDNFHWGEGGEKTDHIETKIIQDADRIDALGAVGIARISYYFGERGYPIYNADKVEETKKIWLDHSLLDQVRRDPLKKWENLNFEYSKKMSRQRNEFINKFYLELKNELMQHHGTDNGAERGTDD